MSLDDPPSEIQFDVEPNIDDHRPIVYRCYVWVTNDGPFYSDVGEKLVWNWIIGA